MKEDFINKILEDIYQVDPSLKNKEKELRLIIVELLAGRPDTQFSKEFAENLRGEIFQKISEIKLNKDKKIINNLNFMNKLNYALSGAALVAVVLLGGLYYANKAGYISSNWATSFKSDQEITRLAQNGAFGTLGEQSQGAGESNGLGSSDMSYSGAVVGKGGGGGSVSAPVSSIAPRPTYYKFIYTGDDIELSQDNVDVLKRIKGESDGGVSAILRRLNLGSIDLSSFSGAKLNNFNLIEDKDFGYSIYVSLQESTISISQNWERWTTPTKGCQDQQCFEDKRLRASDMLPDDQLISIANSFISERGISLENYGQPQVDSRWRVYYEQAENEKGFYIPESVGVVYPLNVSGQEVYDTSGNVFGLTVSVDVYNEKVSSLWNLNSQKYQSSSYPAETSFNEILKIAERGGIYGFIQESNADVVELKLNTPKNILMQYWTYKDGQNQELLVPALMFPILNQPENKMFYQENIVVPLARDLINETPRPMPL